MEKIFSKMLEGYTQFRQKYAQGKQSILKDLSESGQSPEIMVIACSDSRVDPALILQCDPGDLFVVRNVANIVPPYGPDGGYHGVSAALEFGIRFLQVKHLILLGHSQCGGIQNLMTSSSAVENDFISKWVSVISDSKVGAKSIDDCAQKGLHQSYLNCLTFPWIEERLLSGDLAIHQWFFDIKSGTISTYSDEGQQFVPLGVHSLAA